MKLMYDKHIEADTDCRHFAGDIFKCILLNKNLWISLMISLKSVPEAPSNNIPTLVQIMVWCRPSDKPVSEPIVVILLTHICVTRLQWVNIVSPAVWYIKPTWYWNGAEKWNLRMCWANYPNHILSHRQRPPGEMRYWIVTVYVCLFRRFDMNTYFFVACVSLCVCLFGRYQLQVVRAKTHHPLKLVSANIDQRCKRPCWDPYCFLFLFINYCIIVLFIFIDWLKHILYQIKKGICTVLYTLNEATSGFQVSPHMLVLWGDLEPSFRLVSTRSSQDGGCW